MRPGLRKPTSSRQTSYLIEVIEATEFIPDLITLEVGSRGPYNPADLRAYIAIPQKAWKHMLTNITRTVIVESHKIWTKRNWKDSGPSTFPYCRERGRIPPMMSGRNRITLSSAI